MSPGRTSERLATARAWWQGRLEDLHGRRSDTVVVEVGFRVLERDVRAAGGVLGGGLAYRLFFWTLSLAVLSAGALGFTSSSDVQSTADDLSLNQALTRTIADAAEQSQSGRWWLLAAGSVLVVWFAWSLLRAVRLVHAAAWDVSPGRGLPRPGSILGVISLPVALVILSGVTGWLRTALGPLSGILAFAIGSLALGLIILIISIRLPHPPVPWTAHLPGTVAFVIMLEGLSLFAQFYLAGKLANSEALYGALGLASTMLFSLYLVSRGLVWAFELNAVSWEVIQERRAPRLPGEQVSGPGA